MSIAPTIVVLVASAASLAWVRSAMSKVREDQIRRGLFGEPARESLIGRWVELVVQRAERQGRLGHFGGALRSHAWEGAVAQIDTAHGGRSTWRFAGGEIWQVDLTRTTPRN